MGKLKIKKGVFAFFHAVLVRPYGFKALKISAEQAVSFKAADYAPLFGNEIFDTLENRLQENEEYCGYLVVWMGKGHAPELNYLNGFLRMESPRESGYYTEPSYERACRKGRLLFVSGTLEKVWPFSDGKLSSGLQQKLAAALLAQASEISVSEDEIEELKKILGPTFYGMFFGKS